MGCQICKPAKKKPRRKPNKITFAQQAKPSAKEKGGKASKYLSIHDLRKAFRVRAPRVNDKNSDIVPAKQAPWLAPNKYLIKKIEKKHQNQELENESDRKKIFEDFREFKRNGFIDGTLDSKKKKKHKSTFLQDYDVLLHKRINSSSFKSKEFLKVMPSSFLERSKQLGSTVITAEMVENELRRSVSSRKGRQRYYRLGGNRYDTFKKSHFKRTFELAQLNKIDSLIDFDFVQIRKKKVKEASSSNRLTDKKENLKKKRRMRKKKKRKSKAELRKFNSMIDLGQNFTLDIKNNLTKKSIPENLKENGSEAKLDDGQSTKNANTENTKDEVDNQDCSSSYDESDESSNLEAEGKKNDHMTVQSFGEFGEECEIIGLGSRKSSYDEDDRSSDNHKTLTNLDEVDEELEESANSRKLTPMEDDYSSESSEIYEDEEAGEDDRDRKSNMTLEQEFLSTSSLEEEEGESCSALENLGSVVGAIEDDQQIESSFDIDVRLNSEDSMFQGDFALKLD